MAHGGLAPGVMTMIKTEDREYLHELQGEYAHLIGLSLSDAPWPMHAIPKAWRRGWWAGQAIPPWEMDRRMGTLRADIDGLKAQA
jgi:hypothetical protein